MTALLVLATTNRGKIKEFRSLLRDLALHVQSVDNVLPSPVTVDEDGATFAANAIKKATAIGNACRELTLADDSGLEVDALDGRPGVHSARFARDGASDAENNAALLQALAANPRGGEPDSGLYAARFRCALALVDPANPDGEPYVVEGVCEGHVGLNACGSSGFGYDPLFFPKHCQKTLAELSHEEKNVISHRAQAIRLMRPRLEAIIRNFASTMQAR